LSAEQIVAQVQKSAASSAATDTMVPADKKDLRIARRQRHRAEHPAHTASILSKKLAESLTPLLDVKFGCAAFMQTKADAPQAGEGDGRRSATSAAQIPPRF